MFLNVSMRSAHPKEVRALRVGCVAVHKAIANPEYFSVSHIPTGIKFPISFCCKRSALTFSKKASKLAWYGMEMSKVYAGTSVLFVSRPKDYDAFKSMTLEWKPCVRCTPKEEPCSQQ
jgi:hypothetical protein